MRIIYSIVIPVYNEQEVIRECYHRLTQVMKKTKESYELLFVNDGSSDDTEKILIEICSRDHQVRLINLSRNFGHQLAITAGLDKSEGLATVIIDADLQDPPEIILEMIAKWKEGFEVVYGKREERLGETWFKKTSAKLFYRLLSSLTEVPIPEDVGDFRLLDQKVKDALLQFREHHRFIRGLISWIGFRQTAVNYIRDKRHSGNSKYPFKKMLLFAFDGMISFSSKPLRISIYIGVFLSLISFIYLFVVFFQALFTDSTVPGWASIIGINLFFNGILFLAFGILIEYVRRIFTESKNRPLYIVASEVQTKNSPNGRTPI